jgi:formylglycine-generating enzyme required for sulfatase activity
MAKLRSVIMKNGFITSVIITALVFTGCNNYFHELIPPDDNKIISFKVSGQTEPSVITGNSISVMVGAGTDIHSLIPDIAVSRKASLIPLTFEYIQVAFPSANVFTRAAEMYTASDFADHVFDLIREDKYFKIPAVAIPLDFSVPVNFLVISGKGNSRRYTVNVDTEGLIPVMVWIPAGTFQMGSPTNEPGRYTDETRHQVTLTQGFYMDKYQVTQALYEMVMGSNPSYFYGGSGREPSTGETQVKRPVETVSWYDAIVFCNKLSILEGLSPAYRIPSFNNSTDPAVWGTVPTSSNATWNTVVIVAGSTGYRLPTEAQWEYACRAGTTTAYNNGNNDYTNTAQVDTVAWYRDNSSSRTHEVGLKTPNAWGLYDMHGNVWEWCWDWYGANYGGTAGAAATDPVGAVSGNYYRVYRGGAWSSPDWLTRSAYRISDYDGGFYGGDGRYYYIGFRLVRP